jgi:hypothetical protein
VLSVLVGLEKVSFQVHEDIICARSKYFRLTCVHRLDNDHKKVVPLPTVDPATFQMYMDSVHNLKLAYDKQSSAPLVKLYLLGNLLDDLQLRNKAMGLLCSLKVCPSPATVTLIWEHTSQESLLREWTIDIVTSRLMSACFAASVALYPAVFVQQAAVKLQQQAISAGSARRLMNTRDFTESEGGNGDDA